MTDQRKYLLEVRPEVAAFAMLMEQVLRNNDHKGGWDECGITWLYDRLKEELGEVANAISACQWQESYRGDGARPGFELVPVPSPKQRLAIAMEGVDLANFAMMLADVLGGLPALPAVALTLSVEQVKELGELHRLTDAALGMEAGTELGDTICDVHERLGELVAALAATVSAADGVRE